LAAFQVTFWFWRQNFVQKKCAKNVDEIDTRWQCDDEIAMIPFPDRLSQTHGPRGGPMRPGNIRKVIDLKEIMRHLA